MQTAQCIIFGSERSTIDKTATDIKDFCRRKGIEFKGPHPLPPVDLTEKNLENIAKDEVELQDSVSLLGEVPTSSEIDELSGEKVYSRAFELHRYSSDRVLKTLVKKDYPDNIFLRINVRRTDFITAEGDNIPFSYDPSDDYKTEL
jgi:ribosomal protein S10